MDRTHLKELVKARRDYEQTLRRNSGIVQAKERLKNLLFNYYDELVGGTEENIRLKEEVYALQAALDEADEALDRFCEDSKQTYVMSFDLASPDNTNDSNITYVSNDDILPVKKSRKKKAKVVADGISED